MITRKWAFARAEYVDVKGACWIAECRAGTGTWVIRDWDDDETGRDDLIRGVMVYFDENREGVLLPISDEDREALRMSAETLVALEAELRVDMERRRQ